MTLHPYELLAGVFFLGMFAGCWLSEWTRKEKSSRIEKTEAWRG